MSVTIREPGAPAQAPVAVARGLCVFVRNFTTRGPDRKADRGAAGARKPPPFPGPRARSGGTWHSGGGTFAFP
ncbi:hypothetical protein GCM10018783_39250 [Streptomyces griseosporeus]|nr:hypothetical protein GCM10018783_39250 [Streptomyces griseosporeus]